MEHGLERLPRTVSLRETIFCHMVENIEVLICCRVAASVSFHTGVDFLWMICVINTFLYECLTFFQASIFLYFSGLSLGLFLNYSEASIEQPWPSGDELDLDQRGPGFEAHRRLLVT